MYKLFLYFLTVVCIFTQSIYASDVCPTLQNNILDQMEFGSLGFLKTEKTNIKRDSKIYSRELFLIRKEIKRGQRKYIVKYHKMKNKNAKDQFGGVSPNFFNDNIFIKKVLEDMVDLKISSDPKKKEKINELKQKLLLMDEEYDQFGMKPYLKIGELKMYYKDTLTHKRFMKKMALLKNGFNAGFEYLINNKKDFNRIERFGNLDKILDFIYLNNELVAASSKDIILSNNKKMKEEELLLVDDCKISKMVILTSLKGSKNYKMSYRYISYLLCSNINKIKKIGNSDHKDKWDKIELMIREYDSSFTTGRLSKGILRKIYARCEKYGENFK